MTDQMTLDLGEEFDQRGPEPLGSFADAIFQQKYAMTAADREAGGFTPPANGDRESWIEAADRVTDSVAAPYLDEDTVEKIRRYIRERKFIPGGRYLYASGRKFNQVNNCMLLSVEDSREGWADLANRATSALMTGAGIGVDYSALRPEGAHINGLGGESTGPISLMTMVNEIGRNVMQGGSRRSAIWAGLRWDHPDVFKFIELKDWDERTKVAKAEDFNYPARMDMTNISVILDDEFFDAYHNRNGHPTLGHPDHEWAVDVYNRVTEHMVQTGEPGFSIDTGENDGETLRNAPLSADTNVLTGDGYRPIREIVGTPVKIWTGQQWAEDVVFKQTGDRAPMVKVEMTGGREIKAEPWHEFLVKRYKGAGERRRLSSIDHVAAEDLQPGDVLAVYLPMDYPREGLDPTGYTLGWLYGDGSFRDGHAELTLCSDESKECAPFMDSSLHNGFKDDGRGYLRAYFPTNEWLEGRSKGRLPTEDATPSVLAGLFDADGNVNQKQHRVRLSTVHESFAHDVRRALESLGILAHVSKSGHSTYGQKQMWQVSVAGESVPDFFKAVPTQRLGLAADDWTPYRASEVKVVAVSDAEPEDSFCADVGVDEHSFQAEGVLVRNCTEITSADDNDVCNLGSINLAKIGSLKELIDVTEAGTAFLLAGTLYSKLPYEEVHHVRAKNRRLGLGLMGLYEWLVSRGKRYGPDEDLGEWLHWWARTADGASEVYAKRLGVSVPVKNRAIAPNGTISIIGETTGGIEPVFASALKRRYLKGQVWHARFIIDQSAKRLVDQGVAPELIEDAYDLAEDVERRVEFQHWVQQYVDHGISSTINLPSWESKSNNEGTLGHFRETLMKYLPGLRGITVYPDGARGGQPLTPADLEFALEQGDAEFQEYGNEHGCRDGVCGL